MKENMMALAPSKCSRLVIKGRIPSFRLAEGPLQSSNSVMDLGVVVNTSLTWSEHLETRLKKTNKVLLYSRRNL